MTELTPAEIAFMNDVREGWGDQERALEITHVESTAFWAKAMPAAPEAPPLASGETYRSIRAETTASAIYTTPEWAGGLQIADGYVPGSIARNLSQQHANAKTLADYAARGTHRSKWLPKDGESPMSYVARLKGVTGHLEAELPAGEYAEVASAWNICVEALENDSHDALRTRLDRRTDGESVGLLGADAKQMASDYRARQQSDMAARFGNAPGYQSITGVQIDSMSRRAQDNTKNVAVVRPTLIG